MLNDKIIQTHWMYKQLYNTKNRKEKIVKKKLDEDKNNYMLDSFDIFCSSWTNRLSKWFFMIYQDNPDYEWQSILEELRDKTLGSIMFKKCDS